ncbi:RlmE family RNA methyltransferase [Mesosutterella sp. OilRF-GAM-744-9]|uniref:Ribosomal RNA large subunit methyltransferase E n=2 Tax=Mesosutterella TaxID=2494213 RepID=A0ABS9MSJ7_9BURK|nr:MULTISPECIES: RlmE family RNA methyltransferase [unclassified Mesosutterella]MCG5031601.1 RlmE family RNA methyltransferase [Mesosutterella sp. oilRF-744-WT-GAM-9]MCI6530025.1 RlmE family RNA methyltransferase [Mesosutterella sp.]MDL2059148.1 RlmE family RNA methyltransferase [Mesosutterella sp. AGMB02718]
MPVATKKLRSNRAWLERHLTDRWVKLSQKEGYRARSAYKLIQINEKEHIFRPGLTVVDLGAAPGSWSQVARKLLTGRDGKLSGRIVAMDILPMDPIDGVAFLQGDFREQSVCDELARIVGDDRVDVVMSDMAPNLSGIAASDAARSMLLCELALDFALEHLKKNGFFITKAFQGSGYSQFVEAVKRSFVKVHALKPEASRDSSPEQYIVARGLK